MQNLTLIETVYVGLSRVDEGTTVRGTLVHEGTRDECWFVTFPNGEQTYMDGRYVELERPRPRLTLV